MGRRRGDDASLTAAADAVSWNVSSLVAACSRLFTWTPEEEQDVAPDRYCCCCCFISRAHGRLPRCLLAAQCCTSLRWRNLSWKFPEDAATQLQQVSCWCNLITCNLFIFNGQKCEQNNRSFIWSWWLGWSWVQWNLSWSHLLTWFFWLFSWFVVWLDSWFVSWLVS